MDPNAANDWRKWVREYLAHIPQSGKDYCDCCRRVERPLGPDGICSPCRRRSQED